MREGWITKPLVSCCEIKPPKQEARKRLASEDMVSFVPMNDLGIREKWLRPKEEKTFESVSGSYTYFADGDVLLAKITPCFENGKLGIARGLTNGTGFGSSEFVVLRPREVIDAEFLFYFLSQDSFLESGAGVMSGAVGHKRVPKEFIERCPIPLPPLPEQKRIVAILDEAFAGIATAVANTEKNLANARELFESHLNSVFSQRGEGWEVKRVGEVAEHCLGKMLDKQKNKGTLKPYLRNINVRWFEVDTSDMLQMRIEDHEVSRYSVQKGDLLICEGGYPGRAALWERSEAAFFQKALHRVRCSDPRYNRWILYYLYFQDSVGELRKYFTGAGIQHLTGKALANLPIIWPPVTQLDGLLAGISGWQEEVTRLDGIYTQKLAALAELKQSLLQKAFSGELTATAQEEIETALA